MSENFNSNNTNVRTTITLDQQEPAWKTKSLEIDPNTMTRKRGKVLINQINAIRNNSTDDIDQIQSMEDRLFLSVFTDWTEEDLDEMPQTEFKKAIGIIVKAAQGETPN